MKSKRTAAELKSYRPSRDSHKLAGFHPNVELLVELGEHCELSGCEAELYGQMKYLTACFPSPASIGMCKMLPALLAEHNKARKALQKTDATDIVDYQRAVGSQSKLWDRIDKVCSSISKETKLERMRTSITRSEDGDRVTMEQMIDLMRGN